SRDNSRRWFRVSIDSFSAALVPLAICPRNHHANEKNAPAITNVAIASTGCSSYPRSASIKNLASIGLLLGTPSTTTTLHRKQGSTQEPKQRRLIPWQRRG